MPSPLVRPRAIFPCGVAPPRGWPGPRRRGRPSEETGSNQRTPPLTAVIQEIVNRSGWTSNNALVLLLTGTGTRIAESFNGVPGAAPLLHVEYHTNPPTVDADTSTVTVTPSGVPADGASAATLTVTLRDSLNAPVVGHTVTLAQTGSSTLSAASGPSDSTGQVTFTVTNTTVESVTYTATDVTDGVTITQTTAVSFTGLATDPDTSTVTATPSVVVADGASAATLTVTLRDSLNAPRGRPYRHARPDRQFHSQCRQWAVR